MSNPLQSALIEIARDLQGLGQRWALIGGLAVSARAEPRTTRDVDIAVAVRDDAEAEELVEKLRDRGYSVEAQIEQRSQGRLAAVRLLAAGADAEAGLLVDLFFAMSGIETEVVEAAEEISLIEGLIVPVARAPHLLALKILAERRERSHDRHDAHALLVRLRPGELDLTRELLALIERRGFARGKDLPASLDEIVAESTGMSFVG